MDKTTLKTYRLPAPTGDKEIYERRYKKVAGIVLHNQPVDLPHIGIIYYRSYDRRTEPLRPVVKKVMQDGWIRREERGFVIDGDVR